MDTLQCPVSFDPTRPDYAPYGLTCVHWHPSPMRRSDHHNEIELNLVESGAVTYLLGGRKVTVEPGRLSLFWAAVPHQIIECHRDTSYFVATIPLPYFLQWRLPDHLVQPLLQGHSISQPFEHGAEFDCSLFAHWEADLSEHHPEIEKAVLLEMHARLVRLGMKVPKGNRADVAQKRTTVLTDGGLNKVEQMACFIAQHYTDPLTVQQIADSVKLHPNYAMNLFHRTFGTTFVQYLTQHRISHAQRLLVTTDLKITDVALDSGFNSISRFNAAFSAACGCTPRDYRRAQELGTAPADVTTKAGAA